MKTSFHAAGILVILAAISVPAFAQLAPFPTPGTPRTADGKTVSQLVAQRLKQEAGA